MSPEPNNQPIFSAGAICFLFPCAISHFPLSHFPREFAENPYCVWFMKHRSTRGIDMLGRVTGMVSRAPDPAAGNVERIVSSAGHTYDDGDRRLNTRREDGTIWEFGYNDRSEVTSAVKQAANSQLVPGQSFGHWKPVALGQNKPSPISHCLSKIATLSFAREKNHHSSFDHR
jgi:hypothetical protein